MKFIVKIKNNIFIYIFLVIIVILVALISIILVSSKYKKSKLKLEENNLKLYPYQYVNNVDKDKLNKFFKNRVIYFSKKNIFLVGKSNKELQNGYYDIKFSVDEKNMLVYINKLQKSDNNFKDISEEYLTELKNCMKYFLNLEDVDILIDSAKIEYLNLRNNIECIEAKDNIKEINIGEYIVVFSIKNNMLELHIKT